jgi:surface protein
MLIDGRNSANKASVEEMYGANIGSWCVSEIQDFSLLFSPLERSSLLGDYFRNFNEDISAWDVSSATTFENMFYQASAFNQNLAAWNTSRVTNMNGVFNGASKFNHDLAAWDMSSVTKMRYMYFGASSFNQDLCSWGPKLPTTVSVQTLNVFLDSLCPNQGDPTLSATPPEPFCYDCID